MVRFSVFKDWLMFIPPQVQMVVRTRKNCWRGCYADMSGKTGNQWYFCKNTMNTWIVQASPKWISSADADFWHNPPTDHRCGKLYTLSSLWREKNVDKHLIICHICECWFLEINHYSHQDEKNQLLVTCLWLNLVSFQSFPVFSTKR